MSDKEQSMKNAALNKKNVHIFGKTVNSSKLHKVGLPSNLAAFKINMIS